MNSFYVVNIGLPKKLFGRWFDFQVDIDHDGNCGQLYYTCCI